MDELEKIFGVVILYNPTMEVKHHIESYLPLVQKLLVVDNSEPASAIELDLPEDRVIYIADGENKGIAARLNQAALYSIAQNAGWLLTMDQDSFFDSSALQLYERCFNSFKAREEVAMFGLEYEKKPSTTDCTALETDLLITSGSLVNLQVFQKIGGFDENLFIDEVDSEYCFKAITKGYKTIKFNNVYLNHSLGTVSYHLSFKNFRSTPRTLHSPLRVYYMVRNHLYVAEKYERLLPTLFPPRKTAIINRIKNNLLYGKNKWTLIRYLVLAYLDFKNKRMKKMRTAIKEKTS